MLKTITHPGHLVVHGPSAYVTKLMGVFLDMDKMIGTDFEAGLAGLKTQAEK